MLPISAIPTMPPDFAPGMDIRPDQLARLLPTDATKAVQPGQDAFGSVLGRFVEEVNNKQMNAADAVSSLQTGGNVSLHQAVIAMEEANVSFQLMVEVRNKLLEAYQEIMRMGI